MSKQYGRYPEEDLMKVLAKCDIGDCWEWRLAPRLDGYGGTWVGSKAQGNRQQVIVHRFVYEQLVGPIPDGLVIDHLCKNHKCCNPDHLEPVTQRTNIMRGGRKSVLPKRKTHCPRGHEYDYVKPQTGRHLCRVCTRAYDREWKRKRRQELRDAA